MKNQQYTTGLKVTLTGVRTGENAGWSATTGADGYPSAQSKAVGAQPDTTKPAAAAAAKQSASDSSAAVADVKAPAADSKPAADKPPVASPKPSASDKGGEQWGELGEMAAAVAPFAMPAMSALSSVAGPSAGDMAATAGGGGMAAQLGDMVGKLNVFKAAADLAIEGIKLLASLIQTEAVAQVKHLTDRLNMSAESFNQWNYAAKNVGLESGKIGKIFQDVQSKVGDFVENGGKEATDLFKKMGINVRDLAGLSPDQQLLKIAEGLDKVGSHAEKVKILESLSEDASQLLPLLENGGKGLQSMSKEAELLGVGLNSLEVAKIAGVNNEFGRLDTLVEGVSNQFTLQFSHAFAGTTDLLMEWLEQMGGVDDIVAAVVGGAVNAIGFLMNGIYKMQIPLKLLEVGWWALAEVIASVMSKNADVVAAFANSVLGGLMDAFGDVLQTFGGWSTQLATFFGDSSGKLAGFGEALNELAGKAKNFSISADDIKAAHHGIAESSAKAKAELVTLATSAPGDDFVAKFKAAQASMVETESSVKATTTATKDSTEASKTQAAQQQQTAAVAVESSKTQCEAATQVAEKQKEVATATTDAAKAGEDAAKKMSEAWTAARTKLTDSLKDSLKLLLKGDTDEAIAGLKGAFKTLFADVGGMAKQFGQLAKQSILDPVVNNLKNVFKDQGPMAGLKELVGGKGIGTIFSNAGDFLGSFGLDKAKGWFSGAQNYANWQYGAAGLLGGLFGKTAGNNGAAGGSIGAMIGLATPLGPIGAVIGAALGSAVGSLFGGKWETTDAGIKLDYSHGDVVAKTYKNEAKNRGLWRGRKFRTTEEVSNELEKPLDDYFDLVETTIRGGAKAFGIDKVVSTRQVATGYEADDWDYRYGNMGPARSFKTVTSETDLESWLANFTSSRQVSLQNLDEKQRTQAISDWSQATSNDMIEAVFGDGLTKMHREGEELLDTLMRVIGQLGAVGAAFDAVNISLEQLAGSSGMLQAQYADDVIKAAGGQENLNALLQSYQQNFFTERELLEKSLQAGAGQLQQMLAAIGMNYGDNFRTSFEAKQASGGLTAEQMVQWLQAGQVLAQFDEMAKKLADISKTSLDSVTQIAFKNAVPTGKPAAKNADAADAADKADPQDKPAVVDPAVAQVETLTQNLNEQMTGNAKTLTSIDERLMQVNSTLGQGLATMTTEVRGALQQTDGAVAAISRVVEGLSAQVAAVAAVNVDVVRDLARLIGDSQKRVYEPLPVQPQPIV